MQLLRTLLILCAITACGSMCLAAEVGTNVPPAVPGEIPTNVPPSAPTNFSSDQALRAFLHMQEELVLTRRATEIAQADSEAAARQNAEVFTERLALLERALAQQRDREVEALQSANRAMMIAVASLATIGFLAMLFNGWFHLRANRQMAQALSDAQTMQKLLKGFTQLSIGPVPRGTQGAAEAAEGDVAEAIARLQQRIHQIEALSSAPVPKSAPRLAEASTAKPALSPSHVPVAKAKPDEPDSVSALLAHGQALLNLEQPAEALRIFDRAVSMAPRDVEALLKKGTALERLDRLEEAIGIYDQAIQIDRTATTAYLYKGGACNRLKRYAEALACYDQAIKTQQAAHS